MLAQALVITKISIFSFQYFSYSQYMFNMFASTVKTFIEPDCKVSNNSLVQSAGIALINLVTADLGF